MVQIARGTPHGRDRERWGFTRDGRGGRRLSPDRERFEPRGPPMGGGPSKRASWLEKYGPPERTDYREGDEQQQLIQIREIFCNFLLSSSANLSEKGRVNPSSFHPINDCFVLDIIGGLVQISRGITWLNVLLVVPPNRIVVENLSTRVSWQV